MVCGPAHGARSKSEPSVDPFSFGHHDAFAQGMTALATFWAAPWRAAMIMAEEAVREGPRPRD